MAIIALMECNEVVQHGNSYNEGQYAEEVKLKCVYTEDRNHPNFEWSEATPSGELSLYVSNPEAFGKVKPGVLYHVTITKAPKQGFSAH
jgi:hypothetical protein